MYVVLLCLCFTTFADFSRKVGGPDRPILEKRPEREAGGTSGEEAVGTAATAASSLAARAAGIQSSIYNKIASAINERG